MKQNHKLREIIERNINNIHGMMNEFVELYNRETKSELDASRLNNNDKKKLYDYFIHVFAEDTDAMILLSYKKEPKLTSNIFLGLAEKYIYLSQYHCPLCGSSFPVQVLALRIKAQSKQALAKDKRKDFEAAIKKWCDGKSNIENYRRVNAKLCIFILFALSKTSRNKDLDNMTKALLDGLKGSLFNDDINIDHLNTMKLFHSDIEDFIFINIRVSNINSHEDVVFDILKLKFACGEFIDI